MDQTKVDMFLMSNYDKLPTEKIPIIRDQLERMDESRMIMLYSVQLKNPIVALILSLILGQLGIDRLYIGDIGLGILKLLTCGGFGIWYIVDWFLIMKAARDRNYALLTPIL